MISDPLTTHPDSRRHRSSPAEAQITLEIHAKIGGTFDILPSSFTLPPRSVKFKATQFATGGFQIHDCRGREFLDI
jgi:hypothetical protein